MENYVLRMYMPDLGGVVIGDSKLASTPIGMSGKWGKGFWTGSEYVLFELAKNGGKPSSLSRNALAKSPTGMSGTWTFPEYTVTDSAYGMAILDVAYIGGNFVASSNRQVSTPITMGYINYSTDGGTTFTRSTITAPDTRYNFITGFAEYNGALYGLGPDASLWSGTGNLPYTGGLLYKSTDNGASFTTVAVSGNDPDSGVATTMAGPIMVSSTGRIGHYRTQGMNAWFAWTDDEGTNWSYSPITMTNLYNNNYATLPTSGVLEKNPSIQLSAAGQISTCAFAYIDNLQSYADTTFTGLETDEYFPASAVPNYIGRHGNAITKYENTYLTFVETQGSSYGRAQFLCRSPDGVTWEILRNYRESATSSPLSETINNIVTNGSSVVILGCSSLANNFYALIEDTTGLWL